MVAENLQTPASARHFTASKAAPSPRHCSFHTVRAHTRGESCFQRNNFKLSIKKGILLPGII